MEKLLNERALKSFFASKKMQYIIKKGGVTMFDKMFNEQEETENENHLDGNNVPEQFDELQINSHPKAPTTLDEARENLEYQLLKDYLSNKSEEEKINFLSSQPNFNTDLKQKLQKAFNLGE